MAVKGIYFDLYGTLYKYGDMNKAWDDWLHTLYRNFKKYDRGLTKVFLSSACEGFFSKEDPAIDNSGLSLFERRIRRLANELNYSIPEYIIKKTAEENLEAWQKHISLDEQTIPLLETLKGKYTLGLISNFDHPLHVKELLAADKIDKYFSSISISGEFGFKKPDKRIFDKALENANLKREEIIFVGDANDDIEGAINAGLIPVLINRELKPEEMLDYKRTENKSILINNNNLHLIKELNQLPEIIKKISV